MNRLILAALIALPVASAHAQVSVKDSWTRATVPQQKATGVYMVISAQQSARLVEVRSPLAKLVEIHEMKMDNNVMRMRAMPGVEIPAGKTVEFKPGGYHVMLQELRQQIKVGETVPLTLVFEDSAKKRQVVELKVPVRPLNARHEAAQGMTHDAPHGAMHR